MLIFLQISLTSFIVKAVPLSNLMVCGMPLRDIYCSKKLFAVFKVSVQLNAAGHLLY